MEKINIFLHNNINEDLGDWAAQKLVNGVKGLFKFLVGGSCALAVYGTSKLFGWIFDTDTYKLKYKHDELDDILNSTITDENPTGKDNKKNKSLKGKVIVANDFYLFNSVDCPDTKNPEKLFSAILDLSPSTFRNAAKQFSNNNYGIDRNVQKGFIVLNYNVKCPYAIIVYSYDKENHNLKLESIEYLYKIEESGLIESKKDEVNKILTNHFINDFKFNGNIEKMNPNNVKLEYSKQAEKYLKLKWYN